MAAILLLAWAALVGVPCRGLADPTRLELTFGARQEYNDNIFFDESDKEADFITTGIFAVDLGHVAERLEIHAIGRWEGYTYHDNNELDDIDQTYRLTLDYRFTPRLKGGLSGAYIQDYRRDQETEATAVVFGNEERERYEIQTAWEYSLSEITAVSLFATYWQDDYERDPSFRDEYRDLETYGGSLGLTQALRVFHRPTYGRVNLGYYRYQYESNETDYYYLNVGFSTEINETYTLLLDAGPRYTENDFTVVRLVPGSAPGSVRLVTDEESGSGWGGSGLLSLAYAGETTTWEAALSREITASSGTSQPVERTELRFDWRRWFTWEWQGLLTLRYFINESERNDRQLGDIEEDTFIAHPQVLYRFNPDWSLRGSYRYTWEKDHENDTTTERNQVMIEMVYNWPAWE